MKRLTYLCAMFVMTLFAAMTVSCDENKDEGTYDAHWRSLNEAFLDSLGNAFKAQGGEGKGELKRIVPMSDRTVPIYYTIVGADKGYVGDGDEALFSDTAIVYYKTMDITGKVLDSNFSGEYPDTAFDIPSEFAVGGMLASGSGIIYGWSEILQYMRPPKGGTDSKGDFFRVYIPWSLAYGEDDYNDIKGYSLLVFDINLVGVKHNE